jgi:hypothetical protein
MATAAVSGSSIYQELQAYFHQRNSDQQALGKALRSGDLAGAQQEFNAIQTLAQTGPFANGVAYLRTHREQDFTAVGQALQSGDLAGAQQAFAELQATFHKPPVQQQTDQNPAVVVNLSAPPPEASSGATGSAAVGSGAGIVVNLGNVTSGEQITVGVSNASNGTEQVTIGVAGQQNQNPEQITLNLKQNSNQEIVLNLFSNTTEGSTPGSGVSVTA